MKHNRRNKPEPVETWWETALAAIAMIFVLGGMIAMLVVLDSAWAEPETRCFDTAVKSERYCRTQETW